MHLKLKDFESLIECNCTNSWDKNLICTELCRLQCCGKTPHARSDSEMRDSIFLSFSLRRQSKGRRPAAPPAPVSASAENQNLHLRPIFPRLRLLLPAVPLSVAIAKIYIRIFGPLFRSCDQAC